jgi:signal transduction histidine kinase
VTIPILVAVCIALTVVVTVLAFRLARRDPPPVDEVPVATLDPSAREPLEIVERMTVGVLLLNASLTPMMANPVARSLLQLPGPTLPARLRSDELVSIARRAMAERGPVDAEMDLWPARTHVRVRAVPLGDDEVVVFLQDVTEEQRTQQIRRQFVVSASHELKTPVAGLQALAEAIAQAIDDDPTTARDFAVRLVGESERLGRLVQDLLDLSRLEDPAHFSNEHVDLAEIVQSEAVLLKDVAEAAHVELTTDALPGVMIRGDGQQLGLMVRNLIDNAIRYTPDGGRVLVRMDGDDVDATLEVEDTGAGIPLQAQARVFERFFRVDEDRARNSGGTGLGLSIVKHVAELHGGHVSVESELGEGSTFRVRLPVVQREKS